MGVGVQIVISYVVSIDCCGFAMDSDMDDDTLEFAKTAGV